MLSIGSWPTTLACAVDYWPIENSDPQYSSMSINPSSSSLIPKYQKMQCDHVAQTTSITLLVTESFLSPPMLSVVASLVSLL